MNYNADDLFNIGNNNEVPACEFESIPRALINKTSALMQLKMSARCFERLGLKPVRIDNNPNGHGGVEILYDWKIIDELARKRGLIQ